MSDYIKRKDAERAIQDLFRPLEWLMPRTVCVENIGENVLRNVRSYDVVPLNTSLNCNKEYEVEIETYANGSQYAVIRKVK